jgi:carbamoyltransferase
MGMAAYGNASKYKHLYEDDYLFQSTSQANPHRQHVFESREKLRYTIYSILEASKNSLQDKFDIAASLQDAFEARFTEYTKNLLNKPELKTKKIIVFSGGASLNCAFIGKINTELRSSGTCKFVNVSNVPYDGGLSIGSALLAVNKHFDAQPATSFSDPAVFSPYLGREYTELDCISALRSLRQEYEQLKDTALLYRSLAEGKVIAIFNGRSESGRRALGNRSLFADPRIKDIRDIMNQKVKHRPIWRPFAPVILEEDISDWFTSYTKSPYMSHTCQFKSDMKSRVASVVHADGTGRLQTVSSKQNIWLYTFLSGWKSFSGIPILINTSFNDNEPIVESPYHAVSCFQRTNIDILFFPEYFLVAYK